MRKWVPILACLLLGTNIATGDTIPPENGDPVDLVRWDVFGNDAMAHSISTGFVCDGLTASNVDDHGVSLLRMEPYTGGALVASGWGGKQRDAGKYYEFGISLEDGYSIALESIGMSLSRGHYGGGHGAEAWDLVASLDGFDESEIFCGTADISASGFDTPTLVSFDLGLLGDEITSGITFRLYGYQDTSGQDNAGLNASTYWGPDGSDIVLQGNLVPVDTPEPTSLVLLTLGGLEILRRLHR